MVFLAVPAPLDPAERFAIGSGDGGVGDHRANEAVLFQGRKVSGLEQLDRGQTHLLAGDAELFELDLGVAPFADGMVDLTLEAGGGIGGLETLTERGRGQGGGGKEGAAREAGRGGHERKRSGFAARRQGATHRDPSLDSRNPFHSRFPEFPLGVMASWRSIP